MAFEDQIECSKKRQTADKYNKGGSIGESANSGSIDRSVKPSAQVSAYAPRVSSKLSKHMSENTAPPADSQSVPHLRSRHES